MPPLAALGAAAISAVSAVTLTGLATGAAIISAGTGILAKVTGSKTLGKISTGFGIASGAGFLANGISSGIKGMSPSTFVGGKGLLATNNIDDILKSPTKGTKAAEAAGFKTFGGGVGAEDSSIGSFNKNAGTIGAGADSMPAPDIDLTKSFFERANDTLTKYSPFINLAAGVGQGYMQGQQMAQQERLFDKGLAQDQQLIDRTNRNNGTPLSFDPSINLARNPNPYPLLQRN